MKTSLAALAATSTAHSSSTGLMSVNTLGAGSSSTSGGGVGASSSASTANTSAVDINDSAYELRTEFYTREGLWRQVPNGEYVKHHQPPVQLQPSSYQTGAGAMGTGASSSGTSSAQQSGNANDLVKLALFRFLKSYTFSLANNALVLHHQADGSSCRPPARSYICETCYSKTSGDKTGESSGGGGRVRFGVNEGYDDDDDVVFNSQERSDQDDDEDEAAACRQCKSRVNLINECGSISSAPVSPVCLDLVVFNFAREIYFYEFNPIRENLASEAKNLVHKKPYRTFQSTCFDINETASIANSLDLQMSTSMSLATGPSKTSTINLSDSNLSLIVAAGFSKGEIHVFDCYKKEASVFYNNSKLVDKSKVTCIKWLPNSMNLFIVGYSSGSIYLYDANNQTQPSLAPAFTKLVQTDSFAVFVNSSTSNQPVNGNGGGGATAASGAGSQTPTSGIQSHQAHSKTAPVVSQIATNNQLSGSPGSGGQTQRKLVLLSSNQQQTQTAKNPLLKLTVGAASALASATASEAAAANFPFFTDGMCSGANGVNEFAFSPCGEYLAVVSQDGYLRVFTFVYKSNLQMQIELRCSMKSYFGGLLCVCWSPDSKYIVTGGEDDLITVFSFVEMRVACRGRGHSSWVNACAFDPWTVLSGFGGGGGGGSGVRKGSGRSKTGATRSTDARDKDRAGQRSGGGGEYYTHSDKEQDADSDLEDYHNQQLKNLHIGGSSSSPAAAAASKPPKSGGSARKNSKNPVFYRLASCGQDNQICFWDLTDDILREKQSQSSRSRGTSMLTSSGQHQSASAAAQLPQIIIQPSSLNAYDGRPHHQSTSSSSSATTASLEKHHTATQSLMSTAKHLFSKHSDSKASKLAAGAAAAAESNGEEHPVAKSATGFFKMRHKRNSSLNSGGASANGDKVSKSSSKVTLNSYRKSPNTISSITDSSSNTVHTLDSGINSLYRSSNSKSTAAAAPSGAGHSPFNLCPKLHDVPMIEPLICKRIASERLTSIVFREDCFLVSSQDGIVQTWARPNRFADTASSSDSNLPNLSSANFKQVNSTSL